MKASVKISIFPNRNLSSAQISKMINSLYNAAKEQGIIIRFHDQVTELIGDYNVIMSFLSNEILKLSEEEKIFEISFKVNCKLNND